MSHKSKRHNKKHKYDMWEYDKEAIELLNVQARAITMYLISDIFYYNFAYATLESAYAEYLGDKTDTSYINTLLVIASYLALLASLTISKVSFIAFDGLQNRYSMGLIDYSIDADNEIKLSSVYTVVLFYINSIGATELYYRENLCSVNIDDSWIKILKIQLYAYRIRVIADYLTLSETYESIVLVNSKYSDNEIDTDHMQNPDEVALVSAILYLIQRAMLFYVGYEVYLYTFNACEEVQGTSYLEPNELPILGSIFGIVADILALDGFIQIYRRDIDKPVFGR